MPDFKNPYKPGAGHMPPFLAGRNDEIDEFNKLLDQDVILENMVLTGLRGVGKTVLLETFKPIGLSAGWMWIGTDLSESISLTEERLALRLITDLAVSTSSIIIHESEQKAFAFDTRIIKTTTTLGYDYLINHYNNTPGLVSDKLKSVLELVWTMLQRDNRPGIIFAYDEAQTLTDHAQDREFPLSLLLDVFQSIQRKGIPFMLILTGLPTLFPKLVDSRTFAERMFRVVFLDQLTEEDSKEAITKPIDRDDCPIYFKQDSIDLIIKSSGGYPYFIQFMCREIFDVWMQKMDDGEAPSVPMKEIVRKLDSDFFAGRWSRATDRQRELLFVIASLKNCHDEFTVQEVVEKSKTILKNSFGSSHVNQMLSTLSATGLIYKNRYGKYSFAVPLLGGFIRRQDINVS